MKNLHLHNILAACSIAEPLKICIQRNRIYCDTRETLVQIDSIYICTKPKIINALRQRTIFAPQVPFLCAYCMSLCVTITGEESK